MTIQAGGARSASILVAAFVLSVLGSAPSRATEWSVVGASRTTSDSTAAATPADGNNAPTLPQAEMQAAPAAQSSDAAMAADNANTAAVPAEDAPAAAAAASGDDSSGWDKASIIGKIFIACGTLLTLGSAARMFMI